MPSRKKRPNACDGYWPTPEDTRGEWVQQEGTCINLKGVDDWLVYSNKRFTLTPLQFTGRLFVVDYFPKWPDYCTQSELIMFTLETGLDMEVMWAESPFGKPYEVIDL